jgi:copper homeostasis protein
MSKRAALLEVIASSVADAVEAQQGGAGRLEIVSDLGRGGLTPSFDLVQQIISIVSIPVRVMLRESESYEVANDDEVNSLCDAARRFSRLHIDGVVLGFLKEGRINVALTQKLLDCAPNLKATFHHAFESAVSFEAIAEIKRIKQVNRILAHGGDGDQSAKLARLASYQRELQPDIEIIAGGGLDAEKIQQLYTMTNIREFHVGRAARSNGEVEGVVQAARVKALVDVLRERSVWAD